MLRPQKTWEFYRLILIRKGKIYHSRTVEVIIHLSEAREDWNRGSACESRTATYPLLHADILTALTSPHAPRNLRTVRPYKRPTVNLKVGNSLTTHQSEFELYVCDLNLASFVW